MGLVYRAHDERLDRKVAIKLLPEHVAGDAEHRARMMAEARAASALNHPSIVTIHEVGEDGEKLFIVMELVTGETLRSALATGAMDAKPLVRLGAQIAEVLSVAHGQGVVHGDVKPENIMVQPDGRVKLLDFGIARRVLTETLTLTRASLASGAAGGAIAGTLAYMAPETLRGDRSDSRADLFSLGVVLYELAAGLRPFPGPTTTAVVNQILNEAPGPLTGWAPPELARIVHRLLEKRPELRYQTAREVQIDLINLARNLDLGTLPAAVACKRSLAVLPFQLLTPNPEDDYLSVALADAVINQLSSGGQWLVRPTNTVMKYARQPVDPLAAARELNVQIIIEGSIHKVGQRLRVHVHAWDVSQDTKVLSAKHDSEMAELFALQDKISDEVAAALGAKPAAAAAPPERPTKNVLAYELFLRAAERISRLNRWDTRTAIEMLENATEMDPHFADAWARLAEACLQMAVTFEPGPRWFRQAEVAIRRALAIEPANAEAQCARGQVLWTPTKGFQNRAALHALGAALRLNPGCHPARIWQCLIFLHIGLLKEAREGLLEALATNPDDARTLVFIGQVALYEGRYDESVEYHERALAIDPANIWANLFFPIVRLSNNRMERAEEQLHTAYQVLPGEPSLKSVEALIWAKRGERRKAEQLIRRVLSGGKPVLHTHHMIHNAAAVYGTIGKPVQAITLLRKAIATGLPNYPLFRDDPNLQPLHNQPAFTHVMRDLKKQCDAYQREFGQR